MADQTVIVHLQQNKDASFQPAKAGNVLKTNLRDWTYRQKKVNINRNKRYEKKNKAAQQLQGGQQA